MDRQKLIKKFGQVAQMTTKEVQRIAVPCKLCKYYEHSKKMVIKTQASIIYHLKKMKKIKTTNLFPKSSFITGMGSAFNLAGNFYDNINYSKSGIEADCKALENDWKMIGQDTRTAIEQ